MKQGIAYIKPAVLDQVTEALRHVEGLTGMSVTESSGFGRGKGALRQCPDSEITYFRKNIRLEVMVSDAIAFDVVDTIQRQAWTGERGEGKIYVLDLVEAVRIRTNERGEVAV